MTEQSTTTTTTTTESLATLRLPELQARFEQVVGESTRCPNRTYLMRRITETLEQQTQETAPSEPEPEEQQAPLEEHAEEQHSPVEPASQERRATEQAHQHDGQAPETQDARDEQPLTTAPDERPSTDGVDAPDESSANSAGGPSDQQPPPKLSRLSVPELQALYLEVVGRPTGSSHKRYLIWKIRQAQRGLVPVGPRQSRASSGSATEHKVLPLRMEAEQVARLDEARERLGVKNRMDLFRRALHAYLQDQGETEVAALFDTD